ncbi:hypothetical protein [Chryseobacterium sp. MFBS3-17]|uniref:hypothetical protein n=1 Tax=Chryseobacterium sp. MFBS3-17 TaxID=2886689 RepID=UPI001D0F030C|nr:hypothetical protein [Chryseobacterium sp. MFBS3-17]MCC2590065.1 hypothetical protein [Chryseobacterium sp. MFBS3-17]
MQFGKTNLIILVFTFGVSHAQILDRIKDAAQRKIEQKAEQKTDEAIEGILSGKKKQNRNNFS